MNNEEYEELKEFGFPADDKRVIEFGKLTRKEQLEAMELGCLMRNVGMDKAKRMVNGENAAERDSLQKIYEKQIYTLKASIKEKDKKNREIQQNYAEEIQTIKRDIKNQERGIFEDRIKALQETVHISEEKNKELMNDRLSLQEQFYIKLSAQKDKDEMKRVEQQKLYEDKLDTYREKLEVFNQIKNNSAKKGAEGENWIYNELIRDFPSANITDHHTKGKTGDFSIEDGVHHGMIESKDYKSNVPKKEVEKFYKDIENNDQYDYAILASLKSGVVNRQDFCLEFRLGKPIILLHKVISNPQNIVIAYNICKLILKNKDDFNITKEEEQCRLKALIKTISARTKKIHATLRNFTTNMNSQLDEQWSQFETMIQLLNIEH